MRSTRRLLLLPLGVLLALAATEGLPATAQASPRAAASVPQVGVATPHSGVAARSGRGRRLQGFTARSVRAIAGPDRITVVWPARLNATGYTVAWVPAGFLLPASPAACRFPCKRKFTRYSSMTLGAGDLSSYGRSVSSRSGNSVRFRVFAHRGRALRGTGNSSWAAGSSTTSVNWLSSPSTQMPSPLAPADGTDVAITSFNVLSGNNWLARADKVAAQINNSGASIAATQENSNVSVYGRTPQYDDLTNRLSPYGWALADGRNWDYAMGQSNSSSTQATRIYYRTADWQQVTNGALLTHVPTGSESSGVNVDRWISWTKLRSTRDQRTQLCVLDLHLLTNLSTNYAPWGVHRNAEINQLYSELTNPGSTVRRVGTRVGAACAGTPMVVAGDFNAAQAHAPYGNMPVGMLLNAGFVDTKNAGVRYNTRFTGPGTIDYWHETFGTQIDYLLAMGTGGARSFTVNVTPPSSAGSDHYPVTAVVSVPQS